MTIKLAVKNTCRIVPVRFERASNNEPNTQFPDIDDRGFCGNLDSIDGQTNKEQISSAAMTLNAGQPATIKLVRESISPTAPLFVTSSNDAIVSVVSSSEDAKCAEGPVSFINLKASQLEDGLPKSCDIEVRFSSSDGPVIQRLHVCVLPSLIVNIQPYLVRIDGQNGATGKALKLDVEKCAAIASAIWLNAGIELSVAKPILLNANLLQANKIACNKHLNEMNDVLMLRWEPERINVYFVEEIEGALSYTINAQEFKYAHLKHPAVFFGLHTQRSTTADSMPTSRADDMHLCGNDLAHELGHFFSLQHPSTTNQDQEAQSEPIDAPRDTWSMRSLMYAENPISRQAPGSAQWQDFNNFGYGIKGEKQAYRGALLPIKSLRPGNDDTHCIIARDYINAGFKNLYS